MKTFAWLFALLPAAVLFASRTYLKAHPPDPSDAGFRFLLRGLGLGSASAAALPLVYVLSYFYPTSALGNAPYVVFALAGNIANFVGVLDCLRERGGPNLVAASLLLLTQILWLWTAFSALMAAN